MEPKKQYTSVRSAATKGELTEILIVGNQNPILAGRSRQNVRVIRPGHYLGDSKDVMASGTEVFDYGRTSGFVHHESHAGCSLCGGHQRRDIFTSAA